MLMVANALGLDLARTLNSCSRYCVCLQKRNRTEWAPGTSVKSIYRMVALAISLATGLAISSAQGTPRMDRSAGSSAGQGDAILEEGRNVNELYSKKTRRVLLHDLEFCIPANYLSPKGLNAPDQIQVEEGGFGFYLFLPDYGGYTIDNWQDPFDVHRIEIVSVAKVDTTAKILQRDGTLRNIAPSAYGDASARFADRRSRLEDSPSLSQFGLQGYRRRGPSPQVIWTGARSNGEFFFLECSGFPREGNSERGMVSNPTCQTQYYSATERLHIVYRYSQRNLSHWREIDDAIWAKLHAWEVRGVNGR